MDPDQTAPLGAVWSGSSRCVYEASNNLVDDKKHTFCDYALYVLLNVRSVCIRLGFHEMHARLHGSKSVLTLYQIINKT